MNRFSKKKLLGSKWTRLEPRRREKHFEVRRWLNADEGGPGTLEIEAVLTRKTYWMHYREFKDPERWKMGWYTGGTELFG